MSAVRTPALRPTKTTNVLYWISTALVVAVMLSGGIGDAMRTESAVQVMQFLGYPSYFTVILGVAKLLGTAAIVLPVPRMLREWAYAGFTFDVSGAIISLCAVGAVNWTLTIPVVALTAVQLSYWTWRRRGAPVAWTRVPPLGTAASH